MEHFPKSRLNQAQIDKEDRIHTSINDFNEAKQVIAGGVNSPVRAFKSVGGTPIFSKKGRAAISSIMMAIAI